MPVLQPGRSLPPPPKVGGRDRAEAISIARSAAAIGMQIPFARKDTKLSRLHALLEQKGHIEVVRVVHGKSDGPRERLGAIPAEAVSDGLDVDWT